MFEAVLVDPCLKRSTSLHKIQQKGVECLDAPVSGGEPKAIDGTLEIMQALRVENLGDADYSAVDLFYEKIAKTKIGE